jgi:hypothetical protein
MYQGLTITIALWGALVSTSLAVVKLWEIWRDRRRLSTTYAFSSHPKHNQKIFIANLSKDPLMLTLIELYQSQKKMFRRKKTRLLAPDKIIHAVVIPSKSFYTIEYSEEDNFPDPFKNDEWNHLFLELHVAGERKAIKLTVRNGQSRSFWFS